MGWEHAFDADELGFADGATFQPRAGNRVEVLVDGSTYLPTIAEAIARARSHVHLLGWCFSPELNLTREEEPVVLRNLLSDVARRVDVRLLVWEGAPFRVFRPTKRDVQSYMKVFTRGTNIQAETDSCVRLKHSHHEKTIVVDDRVAFVGGIDLTYDGGDPYDSPEHKARGGVGWHDIATRLHGPIVADVAEHFRLRWHGSTGEERCRRRPSRSPPATSRLSSCERFRSGSTTATFRAATSRCSSRTSARSDPPSVSSTSRTSSCGRPRSSSSSRRSCVTRRADDFRIVVLLPVNANDGADVSRGQVAALIHADDGNGRFLACSVYARVGTLHDPVYVHAKIGDRRRPLADRGLGEPERALALQRLRGERRRRWTRSSRAETGSRLWSEHLELPIDEIDATRRRR